METMETWSRLHRCVLGALLATLFGLTFTTPAIHAAGLIVVNDLSDTVTAGDGKCTFREAISNADANADTTSGDCLPGSGADTITFGVSGTIGSSNPWPAISDSVTIDGSGRSITISGSDLIVNATTTANLTALTIANSSGIVSGARDIGGGIVNSGTLTITNCTISDNNAEAAANGALTFGGGIYNNGGAVNVIHSSLSRNRANYGGGIYSSGGTVNVTASTFSNNVPFAGPLGGGGGIYNDGGTVNIIASTLSGNTTDQDGGGIYNDSGTVDVTTSTLASNSAGNGGGIDTLSGSVTVTSSTLSGNTATSGNGGGILATGSGAATVINSTFSGNSASGNGGGIANDSTLTMGNSTLSGNTATSGGGIYNTGNATGRRAASR